MLGRSLRLGPVRACVAFAALVFAATTLGCFDPPAPAVLFRCTPGSDHACPDGYSCEADGCCHKDGTRVEDHLGECALAGDGAGSGPTETDSGSDTGDETTTDGATDGGTDTDSAT